MSVVPKNLRSQVFWEGTGALDGWYSYVNRSPHLYGHIMLAFGGDAPNLFRAPKGFEEALNCNIDFLLKWAADHKEPDCLPVFYRMNVAKQKFRVHILPVSKQEIEEASGCLAARISGLASTKGGFVHYLGNREHMAEYHELEYRKVAGDDKAIETLMASHGIPVLVDQFRKISGYQ